MQQSNELHRDTLSLSLPPFLSVSVGRVLFLHDSAWKAKDDLLSICLCSGSIIAAFPRSQAPMNNEWRAACVNVAARPLKERVLAGDGSQPLRGCWQTCAPYSVRYFSKSDLPVSAPRKRHPGSRGWDSASPWSGVLAFRPPLATRDLWVHINMSTAYNTVTFIKMKEVRRASGVIEHIRGQRQRERTVFQQIIDR